jgi:ketosteroid isomerase-like protein
MAGISDIRARGTGMESNEALMRRIAAAFEQGDLRPLFEVIDEKDVVWKSGSNEGGPFRFSGTFASRDGVLQVTSQISANYKIRRFSPREIVCNGDVVWGLFDVAGDFTQTGRGPGDNLPFRYECAVRWRVRAGKIVEHQAFFDTEALSRQIRPVT